MLAEIFMLKAETAARVAKEAVPRFVPITLPAARPVDDALALVSPPRARRRRSHKNRFWNAVRSVRSVDLGACRSRRMFAVEILADGPRQARGFTCRRRRPCDNYCPQDVGARLP